MQDQLDVTCYFISLLMCSTCFGHEYIHQQELATILLNYHIGLIVLGSMCVAVSVWLGWSGIRVAGFSLQHGYHSSREAALVESKTATMQHKCFAFVSSLKLSRQLLCSVRFVFVSTFNLQRGRAFVVGITNLSK